ncbi:MAG: GlxA family transcriptional regulator [Desulfobacteraceae bacterium]|nr:GlxA family transcriptional regulator [Desulfobacteraceae bacterium]
MKKQTHQTRQIAQIIFENAQILDITGPLEVFSQANNFIHSNAPAYEISLVSATKGPVKMSSGLCLVADHDFTSADSGTAPLDTLLIAGGHGVYQARLQKDLMAFVKTQADQARRIASICSGTFILARAGLLDGKQACTHWSVCQRLAQEHPEIDVKPDMIFTKQDNIYSSAGVTAGIDLALALVTQDHGRDIALAIAKQLVVFMKRQGGQSQFSTSLARQSAVKGTLTNTLKWIQKNPGADLSLEALASRSAMGQRNFSRIFKQEIGMTPGKYVEKMRVEFAALLMETQSKGLSQIASDSGFTCEEMMRRAFKRQLNVLPHLYAKRFGQ